MLGNTPPCEIVKYFFFIKQTARTRPKPITVKDSPYCEREKKTKRIRLSIPGTWNEITLKAPKGETVVPPRTTEVYHKREKKRGETGYQTQGLGMKTLKAPIGETVVPPRTTEVYHNRSVKGLTPDHEFLTRFAPRGTRLVAFYDTQSRRMPNSSKPRAPGVIQ